MDKAGSPRWASAFFVPRSMSVDFKRSMKHNVPLVSCAPDFDADAIQDRAPGGPDGLSDSF
ncbi:MAG: hypothetical protein EBZ03_01825 [Betaproteobacteria bacterium]|nr:hypothetical protein [Betaproteobacteria bacterium]NBO43499.1 hypothetical protein [Betaproteobacteria bacterium]NBP09497.1 hypothetical protein [Betaproteobacteria bacterium]NBP61262.1 hypothetical protein [Betaproteobacteria bacterium]NBQ08846.1 hypothetical protein [Betaproteobacteria bacterium]